MMIGLNNVIDWLFIVFNIYGNRNNKINKISV